MSDENALAASQVEIERLVRESVEKQFHKEFEILKNSVGMAVKIVGAAAALFLTIFTIIGWNTWSDIEKQAAVTVNLKAEELIKKADSETNLRDTLTNLLNRAVVSSKLVVQAKDKQERIVLADHDWSRLRDWLKNENLSLEDFKDTLAILNAQSDERKSADANLLLAAMLNPPEKSPYQWMHNQPDKIAAILKNFKHEALGATAANIVMSPALNDEYRSHAAQYVLDVRFAEGVDKLLDSFSRLKDGQAKLQSLVACASLRSDHAGVIAEIKAILSDKPSRHNVSTVAALLPLLSDSNISADFASLGKGLLLYAVKNGAHFSLQYPDQLRVLAMKEFTAIQPSVMVWNSVSNGHTVGKTAFDMQEFRNFLPYWETLNASANAGDLNLVKALLLRQDRFRSASYLDVQFRTQIAGDAGATLTLDQPGAPQRTVELKSLNVAVLELLDDRSNVILIIWRDPAGVRQSAKVVAFKGSGFKFTLVKVEPKPAVPAQAEAISNL